MAIDSDTVTLSSKFQLVIPSKVRQRLKLTPGTRIRVLGHQGRIELIPIVELQKVRGFLGPIDTDVPRDEDRY